MTGPLYHFTCSDHAPKIAAAGLVLPGGQKPAPGLLGAWSWWTDLESAPPEALGLTRHLTRCDRMAWRFEAATLAWMTKWTDIRRAMPAPFVATLEEAPGAMPMHWWVCSRPTPVAGPPHSTYRRGA